MVVHVHTRYTCDICHGRVLNGALEWQIHQQSKAHKARRKHHFVQFNASKMASVALAGSSSSATNFTSASAKMNGSAATSAPASNSSLDFDPGV